MTSSDRFNEAQAKVAIGLNAPTESGTGDIRAGSAERIGLLLVVANGEIQRHRYERASVLLHQVDELVAASQDPGVAILWRRLNAHGALAAATGRRSEALQSHREALTLAREHGVTADEARSLLAIGDIMLIQGDSAGAIEILSAVATHHLAEPTLLASAQEFLADTLYYSGAHKLAREHYEDALRSYSPLSLHPRTRILRKLTVCLVELGDTATARRCLGNVRASETALGGGQSIIKTIDALEMRILAAEGSFDAALAIKRDRLDRDTLPADPASADSTVLAAGQAYLALGSHAEIVELWTATAERTMSAAGESRFSSIVGQALEAQGRLREAVEIEEVAYANAARRSLELAPLLELAGQIERLVALRLRKAEINFAWSWGTDLVREVEEMTELLITDISAPLEHLSTQFEFGETPEGPTDAWFEATLSLVGEVEALLVQGMERSRMTMTDLEVPATLVIERVCRQLDHEAVASSIKLQRGGDADVATSRWEQSDALLTRVSQAIAAAAAGSTVVVTADPAESPPFAIAVR